MTILVVAIIGGLATATLDVMLDVRGYPPAFGGGWLASIAHKVAYMLYGAAVYVSLQ